MITASGTLMLSGPVCLSTSGHFACPEAWRFNLAVMKMLQPNDPPSTPDYVPNGHACCTRASCWYCQQERPTVPANVELGSE